MGEQSTGKFGKISHFDTERSAVYQDHKGVQYSDGIPIDEQTPKRRRDPFNDKTSAELGKFRAQIREAEEDIQRYKQEQFTRRREQQDEKRKDMDMLTSYNPFGKPGAGAPAKVQEHKKQKFTEVDLALLESNRSPRSEKTSELDFYDKFGKPGGGAPMKTGSGKIVTSISGDAAIRFQNPGKGQTRMPFETFRYKQDVQKQNALSRDLDHQIKVRATQEQEARSQELQQELAMNKQYHPYGKPGGGAPNTIQEEERYRTRSYENTYDPWNKGYGAANRDEYGNVKRHANTKCKEEGMREFLDPSAKGIALDMGAKWAGTARTDENGKVVTRFPATMNRSDRGDAKITEVPTPRGGNQDMPEIYDPFGKQGSGAPNKDELGNLRNNVFGTLKLEAHSADRNAERIRKAVLRKELQEEMANQQQIKSEQNQYEKRPIGELAAIIKQGAVGNPKRDPHTGLLMNQPLNSSDVTKQKADMRTHNYEDQKALQRHFDDEADIKSRLQQLQKLDDKRQSQRHYESQNNCWGRPGGGAPMAMNRKANLDSILHNPSAPQPQYRKSLENPEISPRNYIRNTIGSQHTNHFENVVDNRRRLPRTNYSTSPPWATT